MSLYPHFESLARTLAGFKEPFDEETARLRKLADASGIPDDELPITFHPDVEALFDPQLIRDIYDIAKGHLVESASAEHKSLRVYLAEYIARVGPADHDKLRLRLAAEFEEAGLNLTRPDGQPVDWAHLRPLLPVLESTGSFVVLRLRR